MLLKDQDRAGVPGGPQERGFVERFDGGEIEDPRRNPDLGQLLGDR